MKRAVTYSRVSTKRQAEHESSLEDQQATTLRYIEREGMTFVDSYVDGGASGMTDRRPEFQRMIADAVAKPKRFDVIVVLNYSRFMREDHIFDVYRRKLEKAGVELVSATQNLGTGIYGDLTRKIVAAVDAASSEINASQVRAMMVKNATDGYWNGSRPPLGYRTYVAGRRDKKDKKKLEIDPVEAAQYLDIVDRYLGRSGYPDVGVARLAKDLNDLGLRHRGQQFSPALVHSILTREIYVGRHYYNTVDSRTREPRPREEWILVAVPPHPR